TLTLTGSARGWIGTGGGARARVYMTRDGGASWTAAGTPMPGDSTSGIFGIAFSDSLNGVAVGGDYQQRTEEQQNVIRTRDGGRTWSVAGASLPHGVRYGVAYSPVLFRSIGAAQVLRVPDQRALLAVGPSGVGRSL